MNIFRFKKIMDYSFKNRTSMESKIKDFFTLAQMDSERELLNLMQIARPLFQKKGYIVVEIPFADKEIGALCYKGDSIGYAFLNTSLPKVNVNFALCHEIFHVFYQETVFEQKVELLDERYYEYEEEFAANLFAGMLLLPEKSYRSLFRKFELEKESSDDELSIVVKLMNYFEAPYMATLIRAYELGLLESGDILERLIRIDSKCVRSEFRKQWLDESILNPTQKDDYDKLELFVRMVGEQYKREEFLNERTINKAIQNMRILYDKIRGT